MSTSSYNGNSMAITGGSRRDGEPRSKKRRLLEATETEGEKDVNEYVSKRSMQNDIRYKDGLQRYLDHTSETPCKGVNHVSTRLQQCINNNNRISNEIIEIRENEDERENDKPQEDLLSKLCSAVGIDSDLTVEEVPYPTNAGMVQIGPQGINPSYYQMQRNNPNMSRMSVPYDPRYNQVRPMYVSHPESQSRYSYPESQPRYPYSYHQHRPPYLRQNSHPMYPNNNNPYYQQHPHYRPRYHYMPPVGPISPTEVRPPNVIRSAPPPYQENIQQRMISNSQNNTESTHRPNHSYQTRQAVRMSNQQETLSTNLRNSDLGESDNQTVSQTTSDSSLSMPKPFESCTYSRQGLPKGHMDLVSSGSSIPERHNGIPVVSAQSPQRHQDRQHMLKPIPSHSIDQKQIHEMYYNDRKLYPPYHGYHQNQPYHNYNQGVQPSQLRFKSQRGYHNQIIEDNDEKSSQGFIKTVVHNPSSINSYSSSYINPYNASSMEGHSNLAVSTKEPPQSQISTCRQVNPHMFKQEQRLMRPAIIQNSHVYVPKYGTVSSQELSTSNAMSSSNIQTSPHRLISPQGQISSHGAKVSQIPVPSPGLHSPGGLPNPNRIITPPQKLPPQCRMEAPNRLPLSQSMLPAHTVQSPQQLATYKTVVSCNQVNLTTNPSISQQRLPSPKETSKQNLAVSCAQSHLKVDNYTSQTPVHTTMNERKHIDIDPTKMSAESEYDARKTQNIEVQSLKKDIKNENETELKSSENISQQNSKSVSQIIQKDIILETAINSNASLNIVNINKEIYEESNTSSIEITDSKKMENTESSKEGDEKIKRLNISSPCSSRSFNDQSYNDISVKDNKIVENNKEETDKDINESNKEINTKKYIDKELATLTNITKKHNEPKKETNILPCKNPNNLEMENISNNDSKEIKSKMIEHPKLPIIDASMPLIEECPLINQKKNNNYFSSFQEVFTASVKTNLVQTETLLTKSSEKVSHGSNSQSSFETNAIKGGVSSQSVEKYKNTSGFKLNSTFETNEIKLLDKEIDEIKNNSNNIDYKSIDETRPMSAPGPSFYSLVVQPINQSRPASEPIRELNVKNDIEEKHTMPSFSSSKKISSVSDLSTSDIYKIVDEIDTNTQSDDIFVSRLSLVLEDLVSVPEASDLKPLLSSPEKLLAAMVQKGGYDPSNHTCERQRLREDFLTVIHLCLDPAQLTAWGWDQSSPDYILQQLVKVQLQGGLENRLIYQEDYVNSVLKTTTSDIAADNISSTKDVSIPCPSSDSLSCGTMESSSFKIDIPSQCNRHTQESLDDDILPVVSSALSATKTNYNIAQPTSSNDTKINMSKTDVPNNSTISTTVSINTSVIMPTTSTICSSTVTNSLENTNKDIIILPTTTNAHFLSTTIAECKNTVPITTTSMTNTFTVTSSSSATISTTCIKTPVISAGDNVSTTSVILSPTNSITSYNNNTTVNTNTTNIKCSKNNILTSSNVITTNTKPIPCTIPLTSATNTALSSQTEAINCVDMPTNTASPSTKKSVSSALPLSPIHDVPNSTTSYISPDLHNSNVTTSLDMLSTQNSASTTCVQSKMCTMPISSSSFKTITTSSSTTNSNAVSNISQTSTTSLSPSVTAAIDKAHINASTLSETSISSKICSSYADLTTDVIVSSNNLTNKKHTEVSTINCNVTSSSVNINSTSSSDHVIRHLTLCTNDKSNQGADNDVKNSISVINSKSVSDKIDKSNPAILITNILKSGSTITETSIST